MAEVELVCPLQHTHEASAYDLELVALRARVDGERLSRHRLQAGQGCESLGVDVHGLLGLRYLSGNGDRYRHHHLSREWQ